MLEDRLPAIAATALTMAIVVAAGLFLLRPDAPPPPQMVNGEPWAGARGLTGTWLLSREQPYHENDCKGVEGSRYELVLDKMAPTSVSGRMTMRFTRKGALVEGGAGACAETARGGEYDILVMKDSFGQLEMTLTATGCDDDGKSCPLVDLKGNIRQQGNALVFGNDRLVKVAAPAGKPAAEPAAAK